MSFETLANTKTINKAQIKRVVYEIENDLLTVEYDEGYTDQDGQFIQVSRTTVQIGVLADNSTVLSMTDLIAALKAVGVFV